jgi:eukaryotic-like serine/threonine-protein kinase
MKKEGKVVSSRGDPRDEDDLVRGMDVGEYVVVGLLARGGCGSVYHARHRALGDRGAVKVLHARLADQPKMIERFLREIDLVNLLRHPSIVTVREFGVLPDKRPFFVMEYLDGGTLDDLVRAKGRLTPDEALAVLDPVCAALGAAHAAGVVHRDVKASNIAFNGVERAVKLLDFGIAKLVSPLAGEEGLTTVGRQIGTPTIMAPEQLRGEPVDGRVDVYALGVLLYRLLTGRTPFEATSPAGLARKHLEEPPPRPSFLTQVSPAIDAVVLRCLEKRPQRRYDSTAAFVTALAEATGGAASPLPRVAGVSAPGVALYVEVQLGTVEDDLDDALTSDLQLVLDRIEERLSQEGFILAQATSTGILGVHPFTDEADSMTGRRRAFEIAAELLAELALRSTRDERVNVNIVIHAGEVLLRASDHAELVGGPLLRTAAWAPEEPRAGITATPAAIQGLSGFDDVTILEG